MSKLYLIKNKYLAILLFFVTTLGYSQSVVTGKVTSAEEKSGLPGVSVVEKGTTNGTVTSVDGSYSISVSPNSTLVFSYVGYLAEEVAVGNQSSINVVLSPDIKALTEVVVVGYGAQQKKEITSAVSTIKAADMNRGNITDVAQLLQGKISGLVIAAPDNDPNGSSRIRLRGMSSLGQSTQPLTIIDGVIGMDLNSIDPNDIESVSVLKDASAAAIYGVLGSAGVIIVTTKKGTPGKLNVSLNAYTAAESIAKKVPLMNSQEYLEAGGTDLGASTDWYNEISRKAAFSKVTNVSLSGGTDKSTYIFSFNYRDIQGILKKSGWDQLNGRVFLSQKALRDKLTLSFNLASTQRNQDFSFPRAYRYATIYNPTAPIMDPSGDQKYGGYFQQENFDYINPVSVVEQNTSEGSLKRLNFNLQGEYEIINGLKLMARHTRNYFDGQQGNYFAKRSYFVGMGNNGLASIGNQNFYNRANEATLTYSKQILDGFNLKALLGYSNLLYVTETSFMQGGDFITDAFGYHNIGASRQFKSGLGVNTSSKSEYRIESEFARVNLNYKETYFIEGTVRREGSSMFGSNNRYAIFPAVSAGVSISNLVNIPTVTDLKVRGSWGQTGALPISPYLSQATVAPNGTSFWMNGAWNPVYGPNQNPNPNLKWETKTEYDLGLDFSLLNNRVRGVFDYYHRNTSDLLIPVRVPSPPNLVTTSILNGGELENSGIELELAFAAIDKSDFTWTPSVNFGTFQTKIISLKAGGAEYGVQDLGNMGSPGNEGTPLVRVQEGAPVGQILGWVYEGVGEDGNWKFKDVDGNGTIDAADRQIIGNGLPKAQIGINNTFKYRNFDLNFFFRGLFGHDLVNTYRVFYETKKVATTYNVVKTKYYNPNLTQEGKFSSYQVENADYLKLDNATLGYTFNTTNTWFTKARLYLSGQNLLVFTKYSGVDPEVRYDDNSENTANTPNPLIPGIDRRDRFVRTRTVTIGLNVTF